MEWRLWNIAGTDAKQYVRLEAPPPYSPGLQSSGKSAQHWLLFQMRLITRGVAFRGPLEATDSFLPTIEPAAMERLLAQVIVTLS